MTVHRAAFLAHRWLGLAVGGLFFVVALSGAALCWAPEMQEIAYRQKLSTPAEGEAAPKVFFDTLKREFPKGDLRSVEYRGPDMTVRALVYAPGTYYQAYLHPTTGELVHLQDMKQGVLNRLVPLHRELCMGKVGKKVTAWVTLIYFLMIVSGVVIRRAFARANQSGVRRSWVWRWHDRLGYYGSVVALCSIVTGLYWGFATVKDAAKWVTGESVRVRELPKSTEPGEPNRAVQWELLERLAERFHNEFPGQQVSLSIPHRRDDQITVLRNPDPGRAAKADLWHFDRYSGEQLQGDFLNGRVGERGGFGRIDRLAYDVHFGTWLGLPGRFMMFLSALAAASLPVTGVVLWWRRRRPRNPVPHPVR